jgi:starch synthase
MAPLKICMLSAEIMPFAKTGGLSDVAGALIRELSNLGHEIRAFMPLYASVRRANPNTQPVLGLQNVGLTVGNRVYAFSVRSTSLPASSVPVYFIDCPDLFDRPSIYTTDPDEHRRFLLFTRAVVESCLRRGFAPDIFHCHDWHTAFLPLFLKTLYAPVPLFAGSKSVLTIHNIGYQGVIARDFIGDLGLAGAEAQLDAADLSAGFINPLKTGLKFADTVTTVSPTYAREITETPLGMGMQETLRARANPVVGILNGVDYQEWDPRHDKHLKTHFSAEDLEGKRANKRELLEVSRLERAIDAPLIGMVTRLASQKGIDLLIDVLPRAFEEHDFGLVVLGSGDDRYVEFFDSLAKSRPHRIAFHSGYDESLAHLVEAGSDTFLMPSQYEPCGLNQMYSLRYGTVPIVRRTGGLADSVRHFDPSTGEGTGCVFNDYDVPAVEWALSTTLGWFGRPESWRRLMHNGMREDFSWTLQVGKYVEVFRAAAAQSARRSNA